MTYCYQYVILYIFNEKVKITDIKYDQKHSKIFLQITNANAAHFIGIFFSISVTASYICFPINISILQQNKRQLNSLPLVILIYSVFRVTPTIDIEPNYFVFFR